MYRKGTQQQMMSTAMCIYSSLKHKHGVVGTAICYPAAINLLDVSNSTSLSDLGTWETLWRGRSKSPHYSTPAHPACTLYLLHFGYHKASYVTYRQCQHQENISKRGRAEKEWCWNGIQDNSFVSFHFDPCWIFHKEIHVKDHFYEGSFPSDFT